METSNYTTAFQNIAAKRGNTPTPSQEAIDAVHSECQRRLDYLIHHKHYSPEEAEDLALQQMEEFQQNNANSPGRSFLATATKKALAHFWSEGRREVSAKETYEYIRSNFDYAAQSCRAVGDTLGRGHGGLFLEPRKTKSGHPKKYRIPDPEQFADWYSSDGPLPDAYYSPEHLKRLEIEEGVKANSTFFALRTSRTSN